MESKSEIDPLFKAQTTSERFGTGTGGVTTITLKIPLTTNEIGYYDRDDILDTKSAQGKKKSWLKRNYESIKYNLYNLGARLGISNRIKYSTDFEFPDIDSKYIKEVRVKKIFFALEPCTAEDKECQTREQDEPVSFMFLDKFFLNLSVIQPTDDISYITDPENESLKFQSKKQFKKAAKKAFTLAPTSFKDLRNTDGEILEEAFYDLNVANYQNTKKSRSYRRNVRDNGSTFFFILEDNFVKHKKMFKSDLFKGIVQDVTLVGKNLYVDLYHAKLRTQFFEVLNKKIPDLQSEGIKNFEGCSYLNCVTLGVNNINIVPMLEKSTHIRFDTYLSIRHLDYNDFKYNGYIEIEVQLDLPF